MAKIVEAWLRLQPRQSLRVNDLLSIRLPSSETGCGNLIAILATLVEEIATLHTQLVSGQTELNDLVADYYGLDMNDREVIADFLERF
jgi:hypothetical protein